MAKKIYLAGPSKEIGRIVKIRESLTAAGHVVTSRWIDIILTGGSEHDPASKITEERLIECAKISLDDLDMVDIMVYVVEHNGGESVGAGFELGYQFRRSGPIVVLAEEERWLDKGTQVEHVVKPFIMLFALSSPRVHSVEELVSHLAAPESRS